MLKDGVADLHIHTTTSDGKSTLEERIKQANDKGLTTIAITDHDRIPAEITDRVTTRRGIKVVAGVEIRADVQNTKVEILGYYVDPSNHKLKSLLSDVRQHRRERNREIITSLYSLTEFEVKYEELRDEADGMIGRPHIAEALVQEGIVDDIGSAFDTYLSADGIAYTPMKHLPAKEIIDAIKGAGGVTSLAHPGRIRTNDVTSLIDHLKLAGLDAVEVGYPYGDIQSKDYADIGVADAAAIAEAKGLFKTSGSDCHGPGSGKYRIGDVRVSPPTLDKLRERAAERMSM